MQSAGADVRLISKLSLRLEQAKRLASAAEVCVTDNDQDRRQRLLEETEELIRDANHLVQAAIIMEWDEPAEG